MKEKLERLHTKKESQWLSLSEVDIPRFRLD